MPSLTALADCLNLTEELAVGLAGLVEQQLNGVLRVEGGQRAAQAGDGGVLGRRHEQVVAAGAGRCRVDRGEQPPLGEVRRQ
jgi:hypothetical protein